MLNIKWNQISLELRALTCFSPLVCLPTYGTHLVYPNTSSSLTNKMFLTASLALWFRHTQTFHLAYRLLLVGDGIVTSGFAHTVQPEVSGNLLCRNSRGGEVALLMLPNTRLALCAMFVCTIRAASSRFAGYKERTSTSLASWPIPFENRLGRCFRHAHLRGKLS